MFLLLPPFDGEHPPDNPTPQCKIYIKYHPIEALVEYGVVLVSTMFGSLIVCSNMPSTIALHHRILSYPK